MKLKATQQESMQQCRSSKKSMCPSTRKQVASLRSFKDGRSSSARSRRCTARYCTHSVLAHERHAHADDPRAELHAIGEAFATLGCTVTGVRRLKAGAGVIVELRQSSEKALCLGKRRSRRSLTRKRLVLCAARRVPAGVAASFDLANGSYAWFNQTAGETHIFTGCQLWTVGCSTQVTINATGCGCYDYKKFTPLPAAADVLWMAHQCQWLDTSVGSGSGGCWQAEFEMSAGTTISPTSAWTAVACRRLRPAKMQHGST